MSKRKNLLSSSPFLNKNGRRIALCLIATVLLAVPITLAFAMTSVQFSAQTDLPIAAPIGLASSNTQFQIHVAYAYVGPTPSNVSVYVDSATNTAMHLASQYPSVIRLNINSISGIQIGGCDAAVEVYGIKIATDKGPTEHHAYFVGTNYSPSFSNTSQSTLVQSVADLVNFSLYSTVAGNFKLNWSDETPLLTNTLGSITTYIGSSSRALGLLSAGEPNAVSITIYRIGYVTITNASVFVFADPLNSTPKDMVQLSSYGSGFLYNDLVSSDKLLQTNLFQPTAHP
jgi:hypothetical protein